MREWGLILIYLNNIGEFHKGLNKELSLVLSQDRTKIVKALYSEQGKVADGFFDHSAFLNSPVKLGKDARSTPEAKKKFLDLMVRVNDSGDRKNLSKYNVAPETLSRVFNFSGHVLKALK